ncbi:hypothetical protein D3C86_1622770 [compost metagenome]
MIDRTVPNAKQWLNVRSTFQLLDVGRQRISTWIKYGERLSQFAMAACSSCRAKLHCVCSLVRTCLVDINVRPVSTCAYNPIAEYEWVACRAFKITVCEQRWDIARPDELDSVCQYEVPCSDREAVRDDETAR